MTRAYFKYILFFNLMLFTSGCDNLLAARKSTTPTKTNGQQTTQSVNQKLSENYEYIEVIKVTDKNIALTIGETKTLQASVYYLNSKIDNSVIWETDNSDIISLSQSGVVKALKEGQAIITVKSKKDPDKWQRISVMVGAVSVNVRSLIPNSLSVSAKVNDKINTSVVVTKSDNTQDNRVKLRSLNPDIATIYESGIIDAKNEGSTKIEVSYINDPSQKVYIPVNVYYSEGSSEKLSDFSTNRALSISVPEYSLFMNSGTKRKLKGTVRYEHSNLINKDDIIWKSSAPEIAKILEDGTIQAINEGTVLITAMSSKDNNVYLNIPLLIKNSRTVIDSIDVLPVFTGLKENETVDLNAKINYSNGNTNENVIWYSADSSIAKVNAEGLVQAVKEGIVKIEAKSTEDNKIKGFSVISVIKSSIKAPVAPVLNIPEITGDINSYSINLKWSPVNGAKKYNILIDKKLVASTEKTSWSLSDLAKKSIIQVAACDNNDLCSLPGNMREVKIPVPENGPELLNPEISGTSNNYTLKLSWAAIKGASYYQLYKNENKSAKLTSTSNTETGLSGTFNYQVAACNESGCSDPGKPLLINPPIPVVPIPSNPLILSMEGSVVVMIKWSPVNGANYYKLFKNNNLEFITSTLTFNDLKLSDELISYNISACNNTGCSDLSPTITINPAKELLEKTPEKPLISIKRMGSILQINWQEYNNILEYKVYRDKKIIYNGKRNTFDDKLQQSSVIHKYYVEACNSLICSRSETISTY